jgi:hypothetical protein
MSSNHDGYSTCNEEEDEAIQESPLEADSLLDGGTVIPETLLDDLIVGQKSDDDRSAVDYNSNQSFPPLGETIGTVVAESIPEMLDGSARCLHHHPLLNDAEVESLIMEQQHRSLRYDGLSTSTLIHRQPLLGRQWSITNPVIGRQMHQSTEEANALFMLSSPVDGTSFTTHGDSNNNIDITNNNVNIDATDNVNGTGNGARTRKKRNASATDGLTLILLIIMLILLLLTMYMVLVTGCGRERRGTHLLPMELLSLNLPGQERERVPPAKKVLLIKIPVRGRIIQRKLLLPLLLKEVIPSRGLPAPLPGGKMRQRRHPIMV